MCKVFRFSKLCVCVMCVCVCVCVCVAVLTVFIEEVSRNSDNVFVKNYMILTLNIIV